MFESKIAGVARYVHMIRSGTQPRLVALLPLIEPDNKVILYTCMCRLSFVFALTEPSVSA